MSKSTCPECGDLRFLDHDDVCENCCVECRSEIDGDLRSAWERDAADLAYAKAARPERNPNVPGTTSITLWQSDVHTVIASLQHAIDSGYLGRDETINAKNLINLLRVPERGTQGE